MQAAAQPDGVRPWYHDLLPPLIAFAGLTLLLFFGGENWFYQLPLYKGKPLVRPFTSNMLQGQFECPLLAHPGTRVKVRGWVRSLVPSVRSSKMVVYLDGRRVGEATLSAAPAEPDRNGVANWQLDFSLEGTRPGEHTISVQAVLEGHEPVLVAEAPLSIQ